MCSLAVSTLDSPAVDRSSNRSWLTQTLMSENLKMYNVYYISSCHMLIDKTLSCD